MKHIIRLTLALLGLPLGGALQAVALGPDDSPWDEMRELGIVSTNQYGAGGSTGKLFGDFEFEGNGSSGPTSEGRKFQEWAAKLGLDTSAVCRSGGKGYDNQDAYLMELIVAGPEGDERPVVGIFGVLDGHGGRHAHLVSQWGADAIVQSAKAIFQRKSALPNVRHRSRRAEAMKTHVKELIAQAAAHMEASVSTFPDAASDGSTITLVLWDFEGNFMVVGSMGDSPAFAKIRDLKTNKSELRLISTDQGLDSYDERQRTMEHLLAVYDYVPVAKEVESQGRTCNVMFGSRHGVRSSRTTRWVFDNDRWAWRKLNDKRGGRRRLQEEVQDEGREEEEEGSAVGSPQQEEEEAPASLSTPAASSKVEEPWSNYVDVVEGYDPIKAFGGGAPTMSYKRHNEIFDFRADARQVATSLGHHPQSLSFDVVTRVKHKSLRRYPLVDYVELQGRQLEYLVVASDGLSTPLFTKAWEEFYRNRVRSCDTNSFGTPCLPDIVKVFSQWLRSPQLTSHAFEELHRTMSSECEKAMLATLDKAIVKSKKGREAQTLEALAMRAYDEISAGFRVDDTTILVVRPNHIFYGGSISSWESVTSAGDDDGDTKMSTLSEISFQASMPFESSSVSISPHCIIVWAILFFLLCSVFVIER